MDQVRLAYQGVLNELTKLWDRELAPLRDFCSSPLPQSSEFLTIEPCAMPVLDHIGVAADHTSPVFQPLVDAIVAGAPLFHWKRSYRPEDGVTEDFMQRYGYINLVSPAGPFVSEDTRITAVFWGDGLIYPEHWHEPEELYAVLAGSARFRAAGRDPRNVGIGEFVHHESNQIHATDMIPGPILAVVGWKGDTLLTPPAMDAGQSV